MSRTNLYFLFLIIPTLFFISACSSGGGGSTPPPPGTLSVTVTDGESGAVLPDVRVLVFDADTNEPTSDALITDAQGTASNTYDIGSYYLVLSKQGYSGSPARGVTALAHNVASSQTTTVEVSLFTLADPTLGSISGQVTDGASAIAGVLVVATDAGGTIAAYSSISDANGDYIIYNVPAMNYLITSWRTSFNSDEVAATVVQGLDTPDTNLTLTAGANGTVSGTVTFLAVENGEVDVSLIHPITRDVIPGTSTQTSATNYSISSVPNGDFIARASFENDSYVMDPDAIVKFGEPVVTITNDSVDLPFDVTGTVTLDSPTNPATDTVPAIVTSLTPTLTWTAYPSTTDYVIEVINSSGNVIWGGFSSNGTVKDFQVSSAQTNVVFDVDGGASAALEDGKTYRWRVYASKDSVSSLTGWNLISVSEDQRGIFKVELPTP